MFCTFAGVMSLTTDSKPYNFITSWELIKAPQNYVQGQPGTKLCTRPTMHKTMYKANHAQNYVEGQPCTKQCIRPTMHKTMYKANHAQNNV